MVKRWRSQSQEQPSRLSWLMMRPPYSSFHCQTRSTNFSRPRSWRCRPSLASSRSTTFCVAMPAWSVPGIQSVLQPCMRCKRMRMSWSVLLSAWPMCSAPVTFGGGMTMV